MSVVVITPPEPVVSLALAKQHLRVDHDEEDDLITAYIAAAQGAIDGPGGWLGRAVGVQTLELRLDGFDANQWRCGPGYLWDGGWTDWARWPFARRIELPYPPLIGVTSIHYEDASGADQILTSSGWVASLDEAVVEPVWGSVWPSGRWDIDAVRIRYQAGYATPPAPIVQAVLLAVGGLYLNREDIIIDAARVTQVVNDAAENMLAPYRIWRV